MARDYKYAEVFSPGTRPMPFWIWLFAACAIGGFVALIYHLDQYEKSKNDPEQITQKLDLGTQKNASTSAGDQKGDNKKEAIAKPQDDKSRFDFYKMLPIQGVDIPGFRDSENTDKNPAASTAQQADGINPATGDRETAQQVTPKAALAYVLQAGSFKDYKEADRLKASLALQGIVAKIEKVELKGDQVWHRVRIGPITSEREMNRIRGRLRAQSIEPVMFKVKT